MVVSAIHNRREYLLILGHFHRLVRADDNDAVVSTVNTFKQPNTFAEESLQTVSSYSVSHSS